MTDRPSLFINWLGGFIHHDQALDVRPSAAEIQSDQIMASSHQLDTRLDQPVADQLAINTPGRAIGRAAHLIRTQISKDTQLNPDFLALVTKNNS